MPYDWRRWWVSLQPLQGNTINSTSRLAPCFMAIKISGWWVPQQLWVHRVHLKLNSSIRTTADISSPNIFTEIRADHLGHLGLRLHDRGGGENLLPRSPQAAVQVAGEGLRKRGQVKRISLNLAEMWLVTCTLYIYIIHIYIYTYYMYILCIYIHILYIYIYTYTYYIYCIYIYYIYTYYIYIHIRVIYIYIVYIYILYIYIYIYILYIYCIYIYIFTYYIYSVYIERERYFTNIVGLSWETSGRLLVVEPAISSNKWGYWWGIIGMLLIYGRKSWNLAFKALLWRNYNNSLT
jgi:hypothetical protein